jgi:hypothetical protein
MSKLTTYVRAFVRASLLCTVLALLADKLRLSTVPPGTLAAIINCAFRRAAPNLMQDPIDQCPQLVFCRLAVLNIDSYSVVQSMVGIVSMIGRSESGPSSQQKVTPPRQLTILSINKVVVRFGKEERAIGPATEIPSRAAILLQAPFEYSML